jgi:hypothetical protein
MAVSLLAFFIKEFDEDTPFVNAFLHGENLLRIQEVLTAQLRQRTKNAQVPTIQFSDAILSALMTFAYKYRLTVLSPGVLENANHVFADQLADQNEGRYFETAFWKRWCSQGLPDPNNIPLPLAAEYTDYTVETDGYMLNNPNGYKKFPHW